MPQVFTARSVPGGLASAKVCGRARPNHGRTCVTQSNDHDGFLDHPMRSGDRDPILRWSSVAVALAALSIAATVVVREIRSPSPQGNSVARAGAYIQDWQTVLGAARFVGDSGAAPTLIEFLDLECSACRVFHEQTLPLLREYDPEGFSRAIVHLPLSNHRFARLAARGAECAQIQGRFEEFIDTALASQATFGLESWQSIAGRAGVPDLDAFVDCHAGTLADSLVNMGAAVAAELGFNATPTVLVDGWLVIPPSPDEVRRVIASLRAGRPPYPR